MKSLWFVLGVWFCCPALAASQDQPLLTAYLSIFNSNVADDLPLSDGVTFYGSLLSEPIRGRDNVVVFLNRVTPSIQLKEVKQAYEGTTGACAELVFVLHEQDITLEEAHCMQIRNGQIEAIRLYYDPRPLMEASDS